MHAQKLNWLSAAFVSLALAACASNPKSETPSTPTELGSAWKAEELTAAISAPPRPQADRERDAERKPAQLIAFFGVQHGMTTADMLSGAGYVTEVLSIAVGPTGKVYSQNSSANKALTERLANNRLPNVVPVASNALPVGPNSLDFAITVMNLHDIYNSAGPAQTQTIVKGLYGLMKSGGVVGVVDHVGVAGADNAKLHRMTKQQAVDVMTAAGFVLEGESNVLAHPGDDHTKGVFDPSVRGKTDQFVLKFRKQ